MIVLISRPLRIEYSGAFYHITSRGNEKKDIFRDETDFYNFLELLEKEIKQQRWKCYSYCLMNNHYHLLIEIHEANLVKGMTRLNGSYTQRFNKRHKRVGHLFQGRYKSIIVDKDNYLLELSRYILLNPVRANMVNKPEQWKWSSYRSMIGLDNDINFLERSYVLKYFGGKAKKYKEFAEDGIGNASPLEEVKGQIWLGSREFLGKIEKYINKKRQRDIPSEQKYPERPKAEDVLKEVTKEYNLSEKELIDRTDKEAYKLAVYLLRMIVNHGIVEVSKKFKISQSMVSKIQSELDKEEKRSKKQRLILQRYKV
ncbi:MAG: transposase [Thermodesulfobacteriota bacterium]